MDPSTQRPNLPHVVIVGGGFGGLAAAQALAGAPVRVTLVDRRNHHLFQPLLYQVATAGLSPADIAAPIRAILRRQRNTTVLLGRVTGIDRVERRVMIGERAVPFDHLIVATGARHAYFGHDEWEPVAPGLKKIEDATAIRRRILLAFERAEREGDPARRRALLTFVVVGGGPTGVELAGALSEIARYTLSSDFKHIDPEHARIVLVEMAPRVLPPYPEVLSRAARRQLERLGVEVRSGARVTAIDSGGVTLDDVERIEARTVLWGAGVAASPLARSRDVALDRAGRARVNPDLTVPGHPEIFVIGDVAAVGDAERGGLVPGVAPAAIQEGRHAAQSIARAIRGEPLRPFRYRDKGSLATIGRAAAVASIGPLRFSGLPAWLAWLVVHIYFLIGFRNRVAVILQWAWSYVTFGRGARLITDTAEQWQYIEARHTLPPPDAEPTPAAPPHPPAGPAAHP